MKLATGNNKMLLLVTKRFSGLLLLLFNYRLQVRPSLLADIEIAIAAVAVATSKRCLWVGGYSTDTFRRVTKNLARALTRAADERAARTCHFWGVGCSDSDRGQKNSQTHTHTHIWTVGSQKLCHANF